MTAHEQQWPLAHDDRSPGRARRLVRELLVDEGLSAAVVDDVELLVSEVVTNAVTHGLPPHELRCVLGEQAVQVTVTDGAIAPPVVRRVAPLDPSGRGMTIVDRLASAWGVSPDHGGGKAVWFRVGV